MEVNHKLNQLYVSYIDTFIFIFISEIHILLLSIFIRETGITIDKIFIVHQLNIYSENLFNE